MDYSYRVGRAVDVELVTAPWRDYPTSPLAGQVAVSDNRSLFGLVDSHDPDRLSHMCYGLDYFRAAEALAHAETIGGGWLWFDAGTTCPEIKISAAELRRALTALDLIEE